MPVFQYHAFDAAGKDSRGVLVADNPRSARDQLRSDGLMVEALHVQDERKFGLRMPFTSWSGAAMRWAEAAHELATLLSAGVTLLKAIDTVAEQSSGPFRRGLLDVRDRVAAGSTFAEALAEHPDLFDELSIRLVEVGENSGNLDEALDRLASFKLRWQGLRDQVIGAMIYPLFVLSFGTAATIFLMTYVMPPLLDNLKETLDELPWPTQVVKAGSDLILNHGFVFLFGACLLFLIAGVLLRSEAGRFFLDRVWLRLPLFGTLATKQCLSRAALILSTLLDSGLPLAEALELAEKSVGNRVLQNALRACREALIAGRDLSLSLSETKVIPPMAVQIFAVGQESGRLEQLLERLADDYDRQVQTTTGRLASILEPVLILFLAAMIGFVLLAIILPILEAGNVAM